ncbi:hypothetical protein COCNU_09G006080, partial [Cocos nucifera]
PGQLYFVLPISSSRHPLSLPNLCLLTIKASATQRHHLEEPPMVPPPSSPAKDIQK